MDEMLLIYGQLWEDLFNHIQTVAFDDEEDIVKEAVYSTLDETYPKFREDILSVPGIMNGEGDWLRWAAAVWRVWFDRMLRMVENKFSALTMSPSFGFDAD